MRLPLVILGGSDRKPSVLPPSGEGHHPLAAYKGAEIQVGGRPLVALLVERLRSCPEFEDIAIAGPARLYSGLVPGVRVIDTDSHLGANLRAAAEDLRARGERGPIALASCDVLPEEGELRRALDTYIQGPPCAVWFPLVRIAGEQPREAFRWKPAYGLVDTDGAAVQVWPGHLGIVDLSQLRLRFLFRVLDAAYRTRNLPVGARHRRMAVRLLWGLLGSDVSRLFRLRAPTRTWTTLARGVRVARGVKRQMLTTSELERSIAAIVLRDGYLERFPAGGIRTVVVEALSLAEDIDTEEEADQLARGFSEVSESVQDVPSDLDRKAGEGRVIGRYDLVERIGRGATAEVWRARDPHLRRDVAVKILSADVMRERDAVRRFERETRAVASLSHPNVVAIHDVGNDGGRAFAVTELLEGESLGSRIARGPLSLEEVRDVLVGVARGLAAMHERGIVHRDLKPGNVFLTRDGGVKVLDFGLVRLATSGEGSSLQTTLGTLLGTPDYMSPEQVRGEELDGRSDLFSLGAVAHEMITGRRLFSRESPAETLAAILLEDPGPPRPPREKLPKGLREVVLGCLAKDRKARPGSATALAERLAR